MTMTNRTMMAALGAASSFVVAFLLLAVPASAQTPAGDDPFAEPQAEPARPAKPKPFAQPQAAPAPTARPNPFAQPQAEPASIARPNPFTQPQAAPTAAQAVSGATTPFPPNAPWPPPGATAPAALVPPPPFPAQPQPPLPAPLVDDAGSAQLSEPRGPVWSWEPLRYTVALEGRVTRPLDDGAKRVASEKWSPGAGLSVQADVLRPSADLAIRLDLGWTQAKHTSYQPDSYQYGPSLREELETNVFQLGAHARYHVLPWLAPYLRLSGGLGRDKLTVGVMRDRQWFGQAAAGGGVFLRSPGLHLGRGRFAPLLGLVGSLEAGYTLATGSDFSVRASLPTSSDDPIPTSAVALGHVGRSAPYLRVSFGLAF